MTPRALSLACWDYDRTRALREGRIGPQGVDLRYLSLPPEETFFRMARSREFDAAEMSLSSFVLTRDDDHPPFVAIPVFPSRAFRHSCIFVNVTSGIRQAENLRGKRVGVPEYQMTAAVWIRGIMAEHHGVPVDGVRYLTGGLEEPGRVEKLPLSLPDGIHVEPIPEGRTLSDMLARGEIDALYTTRTPSTFARGAPEVARLFPDPRRVEREYFETTRIFPIMHVVVLRTDVYEASPWLAQELFKAFDDAKAEAQHALRETSALKHMLPWGPVEAEAVQELMGEDFWPYGLQPNQHVLETFLRYSHEQGLAARRYAPDELFAPETLESYVV